ncbi:MAG: PaaI family thioesterase [Thermodesulfobacteriota bacterium]
MTDKAIQDCYPEDLSHCFGCGSQNQQGHQLKSYLQGEEVIANFEPEPYHTAIPGYVYGGLIASLIDCHSTGTASIAASRKEGREVGSEPVYRYVTASLQVDFKRPTPMGPPLELRAKAEEVTPKKVVITSTVSVEGKVCAEGKVVAVPMPESMQSGE